MGKGLCFCGLCIVLDSSAMLVLVVLIATWVMGLLPIPKRTCHEGLTAGIECRKCAGCGLRLANHETITRIDDARRLTQGLMLLDSGDCVLCLPTAWM
jgi:hypothetical protein